MNTDKKSAFNNSSLTLWQDRNSKILQFFNLVSFEIRLVGNPEYPAIIVNDEWCMNAFIKKQYVNFTDAVSKGKTIKSYDITKDEPILDVDFKSLLDRGLCRKVFKIKEKASNMHVYAFATKMNNEGKKIFPLFAKQNCKIYFNYNHASKVAKEFKKYDLLVE